MTLQHVSTRERDSRQQQAAIGRGKQQQFQEPQQQQAQKKQQTNNNNLKQYDNNNNNDNLQQSINAIPTSPSSKQQTAKLNLSFAGCGFLGIYHVGVASCFKEYAPQVSTHKICGSSAGALVAVAHICGKTQLGFATTDILKVAMDARARALGPFHPAFDINAIVSEALDRGLPDDAHKRASGVLHVSLTRVSDGANVIVSEFETRDDLIQALLCSSFIPLFSGFVPPKLRGVAYVDGGFSNNLLVVDDKTITVSPFSGEADICPQDNTFNALLQMNMAGTSITLSPNNLYRLSHALLPPAPDVLKELCQQGFDDGMRYLQRNKLISCNRCLYIKSPPNINVDLSEIGELETIEAHKERFRKKPQENSRKLYSSRFAVNSIRNADSDDDNDDAISYSSDDESTETDDDDCDDCRRRRQLALAETLPQLFMDKIREACDSVNKSLYNWIYSHRPIKYLSYMAAPYYLPVDLTLALFIRTWQAMPSFRHEFVNVLSQLIDLLLDLVNRLEANSHASTSTTSLLWTTAAEVVAEAAAARNDKDKLIKEHASNDEFTNEEPLKPKSEVDVDDDVALIKACGKTATATPVHPFYLLVDNSIWQKTNGARKPSKSRVEIKVPLDDDNVKKVSKLEQQHQDELVSEIPQECCAM